MYIKLQTRVGLEGPKHTPFLMVYLQRNAPLLKPFNVGSRRRNSNVGLQISQHVCARVVSWGTRKVDGYVLDVLFVGDVDEGPWV